VWRVIVAPSLGAIGLIVGFVLIAVNFDLVTGLEGWINWALLAPTPVLFVGGIVAGFVLKGRRPRHYAELTNIEIDGDDE
jgi:hypothetical protein